MEWIFKLATLLFGASLKLWGLISEKILEGSSGDAS